MRAAYVNGCRFEQLACGRKCETRRVCSSSGSRANPAVAAGRSAINGTRMIFVKTFTALMLNAWR